MSKSLLIEIGANDLGNLKQSGYSLCLAKKDQDCLYSIVWYAYVDFFPTNVFRWAPDYEIFATNAFQPGDVLIPSIAPVEISCGQQSSLGEDAELSGAASGGPSDAFTMINNLGPIFPGVNQRAKGIDEKVAITPNFVTRKPILKGSASFTPVESIMVWFQQDIKTSTMFDQLPLSQGGSLQRLVARSFAKEVDFTLNDGQTLTYENEEWSLPEPWVDPDPWTG